MNHLLDWFQFLIIYPIFVATNGLSMPYTHFHNIYSVMYFRKQSLCFLSLATQSHASHTTKSLWQIEYGSAMLFHNCGGIFTFKAVSTTAVAWNHKQ